jgi:PKD repeat protein
VVLTATNCATATATAVHTITVLPPPCDPVYDVDFAWVPLTPTVGQVVNLTGTATGTLPITYSWQLEVGSWKEGQIVTHSYVLPGLYTVTLTATNCIPGQAGAATATVQHTVQVLAEPVEYYYVYLPLVVRGPQR